MTANDAVKIPLVNRRHALVESRSVRRTKGVPDEPLLPDCRTSSVVDLAHQLGKDAGRRINIGTRILLRGRQIEQQIRLDQRP